MNFPIKRIILETLVAIYIAALFIFRKFLFGGIAGFTVLAVALIVLSVAVFILWRCPHCRKHLYKSSFFINCCPYCGKQLK